jgi:hypothetical protein
MLMLVKRGWRRGQTERIPNMLVSTVNLYIPPAAEGVIRAIEARGYTVGVRQTRDGSNRYSVNGARETDALTMIKRFDAGKYPAVQSWDSTTLTSGTAPNGRCAASTPRSSSPGRTTHLPTGTLAVMSWSDDAHTHLHHHLLSPDIGRWLPQLCDRISDMIKNLLIHMAQELQFQLEASKGGNVRGITEDHRYEMVRQLHTLRSVIASCSGIDL